MQLEIVSQQNLKDSKTKPIPFYLYHSTDLTIIFVYGTDMERQRNDAFTHFFANKLTQSCMLFHVLAAAVLCYLRRRERLRHDGYISCWIDIFVSFFGGGNIRMTHRLERWLFGIVYIANFFLMAVWSGLVLYPSYFERDQSIKSIGKIATINPPIFIDPTMNANEEEIAAILRYFVIFYPFQHNLLQIFEFLVTKSDQIIDYLVLKRLKNC